MPALTETAPKSACTEQLGELIAAVRAIVRAGGAQSEVGHRVAALLQPSLRTADFLLPEQMAPAADGYRQHILHVEPDGSYSIVSLVWLPGQATPIHDHVSWCVVGVHQGEEHETIYQLSGEDEEACLVAGGTAI